MTFPLYPIKLTWYKTVNPSALDSWKKKPLASTDSNGIVIWKEEIPIRLSYLSLYALCQIFPVKQTYKSKADQKIIGYMGLMQKESMSTVQEFQNYTC